MDRRRVLIVGGGIAGLALAPTLAPTGFAVEVIERGPTWQPAGTVRYANAVAASRLELHDGDEVHRMLAPGRTARRAIRDMKVMQRPHAKVSSLRSPEELVSTLQDAGFAETEVERPPAARRVVATR